GANMVANQSNLDSTYGQQTHPENFLRGCIGGPRLCRPRPRTMATTLGTRLGDRPLRWLFHDHADLQPCLAAATCRRGSPHGVRSSAGGLASFYAGSFLLLSRGRVQRSWGSGGGRCC